jgi:phosphohistidine phosphatase
MRRLIILRHAKSDWDAAYGRDHDRPLNKRGTRAARAVGTVLARSGEVPEMAITSSAVRARSTLEHAMDAGDWGTEVRVTADLYGTSPRGALEVAASAPPGVERLMLVGHQPTWGSLALSLTGGSVEIKTATVVAIDLSIASWSDAPRARGSIAYLLQPRLFTDGTWGLADPPAVI